MLPRAGHPPRASSLCSNDLHVARWHQNGQSGCGMARGYNVVTAGGAAVAGLQSVWALLLLLLDTTDANKNRQTEVSSTCERRGIKASRYRVLVPSHLDRLHHFSDLHPPLARRENNANRKSTQERRQIPTVMANPRLPHRGPATLVTANSTTPTQPPLSLVPFRACGRSPTGGETRSEQNHLSESEKSQFIAVATAYSYGSRCRYCTGMHAFVCFA